MVYIIPSKRSSRTRLKYFSKYTDCDKTSLFILQQLKDKNSNRPQFRIVTYGTATYYEIAYSNDLASIKEREWKYIKEDMPKRIPVGLNDKTRLAWIISHFTCLAMEVDGARELANNEDYAMLDHDDERDENGDHDVDHDVDHDGDSTDTTSKHNDSTNNPDNSNSPPIKSDPSNGSDTKFHDSNRSDRIYDRQLAAAALNPKALVSTSTWPLRGLTSFLLGIAVTNMPMLLLREASSHTFLATMIVFNLVIFLVIVFGLPTTIGITILQPVTSLRNVISMSTLRSLASGKATITKSSDVDSTSAIDNSEIQSDDDTDVDSTSQPQFNTVAGGSNAGKPIDVTADGIVPGLTLRVSSTTPETDSYSDPLGESWSVRCGPNYKKNKKKEYSRKSLFRLHGLDVFQSGVKIPNAFKHMDIELVRKLCPVPYVDLGGEIDKNCQIAIEQQKENPSPIPTSSPQDETIDFTKPPVSPVHPDAPNFHLGTLDKPFIFVINMQIPTTSPSMMGGNPDGPTLTLLWYLIATEETQRDLMRPTPLNPAVRLVKKLAEADPSSQEGYDMLFRMKALPRLVNENEFDFGYLMSSSIRQYNAKPFLTRPQHSIYRGPGYIEYDLDIHGFCYAARKVLNSFIPLMEKVVLDWGFTLEAYDDDEMPEVMLGSMRVFKIKPSNFPSWEATMKALKMAKENKTVVADKIEQKQETLDTVASTSPVNAPTPSTIASHSTKTSTDITPSKKVSVKLN